MQKQRYVNVLDFIAQQNKLAKEFRYTLDKSKFIFTQTNSHANLVYAYIPVDNDLQEYINNMRKQELKHINFMHTLAGNKHKIKLATTTKLRGKIVL